MVKQIINIGVEGNDATGDAIRDAFSKTNENFNELYSSIGQGDGLSFTALSEYDKARNGHLVPDSMFIVNDAGNTIQSKVLTAGAGIQIDNTDPNKITLVSTGSSLVTDLHPKLGNNMDGNGYAITDIDRPDGANTAAFLLANPSINVRSTAVNKGYADDLYVNMGGDIMRGALNVPAGASGTQVPQRQEVVGIAGSTMTGPLVLSGDPTDSSLASVAATKNYVDTNSYYSKVNLFVSSTSGNDFNYNIPEYKRGRALPYAYKTISAACQAAARIIAASTQELGIYQKPVYYGGGTSLSTVVSSVPSNYYANLTNGSGSGTTITVSSTSGLVVGMVVYVASGAGNFASGTLVTSVNLDGVTFVVNQAPTTALSGATVYGVNSTTQWTLTITNGGSGTDMRKVTGSGPTANSDVRAGLLLLGTTSGALAIIDYIGTINSVGSTETYQVSYTSLATFKTGETLQYGQPVPTAQITIKVESGEYYENYPIRVPNNVSIVGDDTRRVIIRPRPGLSASSWSNTFFRRDYQIDGLTKSSNYGKANIAANSSSLFGYHYLTDPTKSIYSKTVNNAGSFYNAQSILNSNKSFIVAEVAAYVAAVYPVAVTATASGTGYLTCSSTTYLNANMPIVFSGTTFGNIVAGTTYYVKTVVDSTHFTISTTSGGTAFTVTTASGSMTGTYPYNTANFADDVSSIVDHIGYDLLYGNYYKTLHMGSKYFYNSITSNTLLANEGHLKQSVATITKINSLINSILNDTAPGTVYQSTVPQIFFSSALATVAYGSRTSINFSSTISALPVGTIVSISGGSITGNMTIGGAAIAANQTYYLGYPITLSSATLYSSYSNAINSTNPLAISSTPGTLSSITYSSTTTIAFPSTGSALPAGTMMTIGGTITGTMTINGITIASGQTYYLGSTTTTTASVYVCYADAVAGTNPLVVSSGSTTGATFTYTILNGTTTGATFTYTILTPEYASITAVQNLSTLITDVINQDTSFNPPKNNEDMDVFMLNDANRLIQLSAQGHGGFMTVLDPIGQILTKSPYIQQCSSFTKSINAQAFSGGMYIDAFSGNLKATVSTRSDQYTIIVSGLNVRAPQIPFAFIANGIRFEVDFVSNYVAWNGTTGGTATLNLNLNTPDTQSYTGSSTSILTPSTVVELQTAGNRSALTSDFTQINDMGYGIVATNGSLIEAVSVFCYYAYRAFYAINGSQIRSLNSSVAYGVYALNSEGSSPIEVPNTVTLTHPLFQVVTAFTTILGSVVYGSATTISYTSTLTALPVGTSVTISGSSITGTMTIGGVAIASGQTYYLGAPITATSATLYANYSNAISSTSPLAISNNATTGATFTYTMPSSIAATNTAGSFTLYVNNVTRPIFNISNIQIVHANTPTGTSTIANYTVNSATKTTTVGAVGLSTIRVTGVSGSNVLTTVSPSTTAGLAIGMSISGTPTTNAIITAIYNTLSTVAYGSATTIGYASTGTAIPVGTSITLSGTITGTMTIGGVAIATGQTYYVGAPVTTTSATLYATAANAISSSSPLAISNGATTGAIFTYAGNNYNTGTTIVLSSALTANYTGFPTFQQYVYALNLSTTGLFSGSSGNGLLANVPNNTSIIVQSLENFEFTGVNATSTTRPTSALQFTGDSNIYSVIGRNSGTGTNGIVSGDSIISTSAPYGYIPINVDLSAGSATGTGQAGDTTIRIIGGSSSLAGLQFAWGSVIHTISTWTAPTGGNSWSTITVTPALSATVYNVSYNNIAPTLYAGYPAGTGAQINYIISVLRASNTDLVNIGTGSYADSNIPNDIYGSPNNIPSSANQIKEIGKGRVFYSATDQDGNFSVGKYFSVQQATGIVTLSSSISLSNISGLGFSKGITVNEFSTDTLMLANSPQTVPVQTAIIGYINNRLGIDPNSSTSTIIAIGPGFMPRDGSLSATANMNLGNNKISNLADPTISTDAATKNYADNAIRRVNAYGYPRTMDMFTMSGTTSLAIMNIARTSGVATATTEKPHALPLNGLVTISGISTAGFNTGTANATATTITANTITLSTTVGTAIGNAVVFSGTTFGGITAGVTYYVTGVSGTTGGTITVSLTSGGTNVTLSTASGTMGMVTSVPVTPVTATTFTYANAGSDIAAGAGTTQIGTVVIPSSIGMNGNTITGLPTPSTPTDAATKSYVDAHTSLSTLSDVKSVNLATNTIVGYLGSNWVTASQAGDVTTNFTAYVGSSTGFFATSSIGASKILDSMVSPSASISQSKLSINDATTGVYFTGTIATTTLTVAASPAPVGTIAIGQVITGSGVAPGTVITALGGGTGGAGTYTISISQTVGSATPMYSFGTATYFTGAISGTTLTVAASPAPVGTIIVGQTLTGTGVSASTIITAFVSGNGGAGTYTVSVSQTVSSTVISANSVPGSSPSKGLSIYDPTNFTVTNGLVKIASNGISLANLANLGNGLVIGNNTGVSATPIGVAFTSANTASTIVYRDASNNFSAGTITANLTGNASGTASGLSGNVSANYVYAGPGSGSATTATFRQLVSADIPTLSTLNISAGSLATTLGSQVIMATFSSTDANANNLIFSETRDGAGTSWTSAGSRIQEKIDATWMGYIQFNGANNNGGVTIGTGSSTVGATGTGVADQVRIDSSGNVAVLNGNLNVTTAGAGVGGITAIQGTQNVSLRPKMAVGNNNPIVQAGDMGIIYSGASAGASAYFVIAPWSNTASGIRMDATGNVLPGTTNTQNLGSSSLSWGTMYGTATSADYADLAEMYAGDKDYEPGTVVMIGGEFEVTIAKGLRTTKVAGVVSTNPAHLMNSKLVADHPIAVALTGRVPCKVIGKITKGDMLTVGLFAGVASADETPVLGSIIGKALEDYDSDKIGVIEVLVGKH
jgi:hypothetical protein